MSEQQSEFRTLLKNKPPIGTVLVSHTGIPVPVFVDHKPDIGDGAKRIMFANALIDEKATGWFLMDSSRGLKCLILPESQRELIELHGGGEEGLTVTQLRVVRHNSSNTALICELY
jgi:hypothetical protein